ncbi:hypothetical protein ACFRCX_01890 [Streptomyces sp. NPDC056652]|uniref:hypothetical protein n=1 Tax=Streptomyces sp. NPDC056652 TaxID=3345893 RepID=UPI00367F3724
MPARPSARPPGDHHDQAYARLSRESSPRCAHPVRRGRDGVHHGDADHHDEDPVELPRHDARPGEVAEWRDDRKEQFERQPQLHLAQEPGTSTSTSDPAKRRTAFTGRPL